MVIKNKKGWFSVVEAFLSILLLAGILVIILNSDSISEEKENFIYTEQEKILKIIQIDDNLRSDILAETLSAAINSTINDNLPGHLECKGVICDFTTNSCSEISLPDDKEIFVRSVLISTDGTTYSQKEFRLFCWEK